MVPAFAISLGVFCALLAPETPSDIDIKAYQDAKAHVQRDPQANIRLALWCEAHGMNAERLKHLAMAVLADPNSLTARGLMGLVRYQGEWKKPEQVSQTVQGDAKLSAALAEYNARRAKTAHTVDAQWQMALWCEKQGLVAEANAHLTTVVRLDPTREAAWKKLGYKQHKGRWRTSAQIEAEKAEATAQEKATRHWMGQLEKIRGGLAQKSRRAECEAALAAVTDPRAVPAVWKVFVTDKPGHPAVAVQVLGQIQSPAASRCLVILAVFADSAAVRRAATETLSRRDAREFADLLISLIRKPIKYQVKPVNGLNGPGELLIEGEKANLKRVYSAGASIQQALQPGDVLQFDAMGRPLLMRQQFYNSVLFEGPTTTATEASGMNPLFTRPTFLNSWQALPAGFGEPDAGLLSYNPVSPWGVSHFDANIYMSNARGGTILKTTVGGFVRNIVMPLDQTVAASQQQQQSDTQLIEAYNASLTAQNGRVIGTLREVSGVDFGTDQKAWTKWWVDQIGMAYRPQPEIDVPTVVQDVSVPVAAQVQDTLVSTLDIRVHHSCFAAGTLVRTLAGLRPIESIRGGDQVLFQNTKTGELSFQPVLAVYHNPPAPTYKIELDGESIVATGIHRFWKAGGGWTMARDLKPGDPLRVLDGRAEILAVGSDRVQPVFNLEVAEGHTFFVGTRGILVHDNSLVQPATEPFDTAPDLNAGAGATAATSQAKR